MFFGDNRGLSGEQLIGRACGGQREATGPAMGATARVLC